MKVSIITVTLNSEHFIEDCIISVLNQDYPNIEYIIIDGGSSDKTLEIIRRFESRISKWVSERDFGIYDAINRGISLSSGEIIGILNSDDTYINTHVIRRVVQEFRQENVDCTYADVIMVDRYNSRNIVRYYDASNFNVNKLALGFCPPHPTFFVKSKVYQEHGLYNLNYKIAADYELITRFLYRNKISFSYIPAPLVIMRTGGKSNGNIKKYLKNSKEIIRATKDNKLKTSPVKIYLRGIVKVYNMFLPTF